MLMKYEAILKINHNFYKPTPNSQSNKCKLKIWATESIQEINVGKVNLCKIKIV